MFARLTRYRDETNEGLLTIALHQTVATDLWALLPIIVCCFVTMVVTLRFTEGITNPRQRDENMTSVVISVLIQ